MTKHLSKIDIQRFRVNELPPAELLELDDHLSGCDECRNALIAGGNVARANAVLEHLVSIPSGTDTNHLRYRELEGFVDNTLEAPARQRLEIHLAVCEECVNEIEGLRTLATPKSVETSVQVASPLHTPSVLESVGHWNFRRLLSFGIPAGAFVCLVVAAWLWSALSTTPGEQNVAAVELGDGQILTSQSNPSVVSEIPSGQHTVTVAETPTIRPGNANNSHSESSEMKLAVSLIEEGRTVGLTESGQLAGYDLIESRYRQLIANSLRTEKVVIGQAVRGLSPGTTTTMGNDDPGSGSFRLNGPVGRVVSSNRPKFTWHPLEGAESYIVDIYDTSFNKIATSGSITANEWTTSVRRGRTYLWQVTAVRGGEEIKAPQRPEPEAKFMVLTQLTANEIDRLRKRFPRSNLLLGLAYAEAGLVDEAAQELEKLLRDNPESKLVGKFLSQIRERDNRQK